MAIFQLGEFVPDIHETAFVADSARVVGRVVLGEDVSVWFGAVLRAEAADLRIGRGSNVQDNAVLHVDPGIPLNVGEHVTVGHQAMLHGCTVGDGALIGIQAVVLNHARIGRDCVVGAGSVVTEGKEFPDRSLILGAPAKVVRELTPEQVTAFRAAALSYVARGKLYRQQLRRIDG
jgi:carbonic anhydrase/acetyltransferase-like protein (isoleucine patch superfamily)